MLLISNILYILYRCTYYKCIQFYINIMPPSSLSLYESIYLLLFTRPPALAIAVAAYAVTQNCFLFYVDHPVTPLSCRPASTLPPSPIILISSYITNIRIYFVHMCHLPSKPSLPAHPLNPIYFVSSF